jgi:hypothetical protein
MFVKYGDKTDSFVIEKAAGVCEKCGEGFIKINNILECKCSKDKKFEKSKKIFTQENISTNFQENKRVEEDV